MNRTRLISYLAIPLLLGLSPAILAEAFLTGTEECRALRGEQIATFTPYMSDNLRSRAEWERKRGLYLRDVQRSILARARDDMTDSEYDALGRLVDASLDTLYARIDLVTKGDSPSANDDVSQTVASLNAASGAVDGDDTGRAIARISDMLRTSHELGRTGKVLRYQAAQSAINDLIYDALCQKHI